MNSHDVDPAVSPEPRYGIRITYVSWGTVDGGGDLVGSKTELEAIVARWRADSFIREDQTVTYEIAVYDGVDPADRTDVEQFLARDTKARE